MNKKIISILIGISMMAASVVPAFANENSNEQEIEIVLEETELEDDTEVINDIQSEDVLILQCEDDEQENDESTIEEVTEDVIEDKENDIDNDDASDNIDVPLASLDGAYDASVMRYQKDADWVTSWSSARTYVDEKVEKGNQWICFWINNDDDEEDINLRIYAQAKMCSKFGGACRSMSYTGYCQWTSPYPKGTCIQCYTMDWFDANVCNIPNTVSLEETSDGIKVTWEPVSNVNDLYLHIGNTLCSVDVDATEYIYKKGKEGQSYNVSLYAENDYTYVESDYATIKCTHNGSGYECSHSFNKPTFSWSEDCLSCKASAKCKICNTTKTVNCYVSKTKYQKADFSIDGETTYRAYTNELGIGSYYDLKTVKYPRLKSVKVNAKKYTYKGKKIKPSVVVKDINGDTVPKGFYVVDYYDNNAPGKAMYSVTFTGAYCGSYTGYYDIVLDKPNINKLTVKKNTITVTLDKVPRAKNYVVEYSDNKNFKNSKKITSKKTTIKLSKLKAKKKYYIRVKAVSNGKYSSNSKVKSIKTKK